MPDFNYYFFINSSYLKTSFISLTNGDDPSPPFYNINIYENFNKENNTYSKIEEIRNISFNENNNQIWTDLSYKTEYYNTSFTCLELIPDRYIKSMNVAIDIGGDIYYLKMVLKTLIKIYHLNFNIIFLLI